MRSMLPHKTSVPPPKGDRANQDTHRDAFAPQIVHDVLAAPGRPLGRERREWFEPRFGHDFSRVRVHDDAQAARSADSVGAQAYAVGEHIVLGDTPSGNPREDRILAHELAHTIQQRNAGVPPGHLPIGSINSPGEDAARRATEAAMSGETRAILMPRGEAMLQRQPKPDAKPEAGKGDENATDGGAKKDDDDEPTPWLTLQGQGFLQFSQVYTVPAPPPWLLGGQLGANVQFHSGKTGFELGLFCQYGRVMKWNSQVTAGGDQYQAVVQPSWVVVNSGKWQVALFGQGGGGVTSSSDPMVAGKQFSLTTGSQVTYEIFSHDRFKLQGGASAAVGEQWSKGPGAGSYSGSDTWQISTGLQLSFDLIKRKKPPPPPENVTVPVPAPEQPKAEPGPPKKNDQDAGKKPDDAPKKDPGNVDKPANQPPASPPLPVDGRIFFTLDRPLERAPSDHDVLQRGLGDDLPALKTRTQSTLAADPNARVMFLGFASVDGPDAGYNCRLGLRRAQWLRQQIVAPAGQVAVDAGASSGSCASDQAGATSFGSTRAADTKSEDERRLDRYGIVHFFRP
jgi:hypothetical protein